jgi:hypothetical protein
MKRFLRYFIIFLTTGFFSCDTESNLKDPTENYFVKYYGGDGDQRGVDMLPLPDGNFLLLGNSEFAGTKSIILIKIDPKGEILWQKTFQGTTEEAVDIEPLSDGNFVVLASLETAPDNHDVKLIIVSPDGDEITSASHGSSTQKNETPKSVTPLRDGGFIIAGITVADMTPDPQDNPDLYTNIFHFRCDASLTFDNTNWDEYYGSLSQLDGAIKIFQDPAQDFYVFGYSDQKIRPDQETFGKIAILYYRAGAGGTPDSQLGVLGIEEAQDLQDDIRTEYVHQVKDELGGGFLLVATRFDANGQTSLQATRLRAGLEFSPIKDKQFDKEITIGSTSLEAKSATTSLVAPQGFLLLGEELRSLGAKNLSLTKIDQIGQVVWSVSLGSEEEDDEGAAVLETTDGKILVLGTVELGDNQTKMALFKLNSTGRLHD